MSLPSLTLMRPPPCNFRPLQAICNPSYPLSYIFLLPKFDFPLNFRYNISIKERKRKFNLLTPFVQKNCGAFCIRKDLPKFENLRKFLYNISVKSKGRKPNLPFEKIKLKKLGGGQR